MGACHCGCCAHRVAPPPFHNMTSALSQNRRPKAATTAIQSTISTSNDVTAGRSILPPESLRCHGWWQLRLT